jgi:chlorite dismutase
MEERQRMMDEHIRTGRTYPGIKINTTYSFGLDDQEFVVAFEGDSPGEFLDLVMDLRASEASAYTLRDTPSFTGVAVPLQSALEMALGLPVSASAAGDPEAGAVPSLAAVGVGG